MAASYQTLLAVACWWTMSTAANLPGVSVPHVPNVQVPSVGVPSVTLPSVGEVASEVKAATGATSTGVSVPTLLPYAPQPGVCPNEKLVRAAGGRLGASEAAWMAKKKPMADQALRSWLQQFGDFPAAQMPTIGSAIAGGYLRASLLGAGIHQALSIVEGQGPMRGLLKAISYETTLSGSAAFQGGLQQNNWPTIASLSSGLWEPNYAHGMQPGADEGQEPEALAQIGADCAAKSAAGFPATEIDLFGRIIGWSNLYGNDGGVTYRLSDTRAKSNFVNALIPFPIFTSTGTVNGIGCYPGANGSQYEYNPFEFGSWDYGINAFMDMKYLGTHMLDGNPATPVCTTGFDNLSFLMGATANVLAWGCTDVQKNVPGGTPVAEPPLAAPISTLVGAATYPLNRRVYAPIPNPFLGMAGSPRVNQQAELTLVDGGNTGQVIPLWPLLNRPNVGVSFLWDNYYDLGGVGTTGNQLHNTYLAAQTARLTRMPVIPPAATFEKLGLNTRPTGFGCNDPNVQTFIYVPYRAYIPQTQATSNLTTTPQQTRNYIINGNRLVTNNNNPNWPRCVACLIMKKSASSLPGYCQACFNEYCYN